VFVSGHERPRAGGDRMKRFTASGSAFRGNLRSSRCRTRAAGIEYGAGPRSARKLVAVHVDLAAGGAVDRRIISTCADACDCAPARPEEPPAANSGRSAWRARRSGRGGDGAVGDTQYRLAATARDFLPALR
jgi:hypothetical protein